MTLAQSARSRWLLCFALAMFQTLVGLSVASLAVVQMVLGKYFHVETPHVDTCYDSTVAAVLQGITLLVSGALGISAYGPIVKPGERQAPRLVLVVTYVLFSSVVAFVGYNAALPRGCFALGRGGEKEIFGVVVARVVLSYLCHIVGGLGAGFAVPDVCSGIVNATESRKTLHNVVQNVSSPAAAAAAAADNQLTVITLPSDASTIYAVPENRFVVQNRDGSVSVRFPEAETPEPSESVQLMTQT